MSNFEAKTAEEFRGEPTSEAAPGSKVPEADVGGLEFFRAGRFYTYSHDTPSQSANGESSGPDQNQRRAAAFRTSTSWGSTARIE